MTATAYLAGPDVFLPNAVAHAARKVAICRRYGLRGLPPLNEDVETAAKALDKALDKTLDVWQSIYEKDIAMMERCDIIIANLTPFGGASADAGTLIEVGWFLGQRKPVFGYSNNSESFEQRMRRQLGEGHADLGIEGFHLPDNLMIVGAVHSGGYPSFFQPTAKHAASMRSMCSRPASRRRHDILIFPSGHERFTQPGLPNAAR